MKRIVIFFVGCLLAAAFCQEAMAQSAEEAYVALKKLESRIDVGVSLIEYRTALGDVKGIVTLYLESRDATEKKDLAKQLENALALYEFAFEMVKLTNGIPPDPIKKASNALKEARAIMDRTK